VTAFAAVAVLLTFGLVVRSSVAAGTYGPAGHPKHWDAHPEA
jgi:hypothetical protein